MIPTLHVGSAIAAGPLTLFPVWTDAPVAPAPIGDLSTSGVTVAELDSPQVPLLSATNGTTSSVLLVEGTLLGGGHQHRVLTRDVLLAAGRTAQVPVRCVEQGRWGGGALHAPTAQVAAVAVRAASAAPADDHETQSRVWDRIERLHGSEAGGTRSLSDLQHRRADGLRSMLRTVRPLPGQRGVVVGAAGQPVLIEVFQHERLLAARWEELLLSVAVQAVGVPYAPVPGRRARRLAARAQESTLVVRSHHHGIWATSAPDQRVATSSLRSGGHVLHAAAIDLRHHFALTA